MKRVVLFPFLLVLLLTGCATTSVDGGDAPAADSAKKEEPAKKIAELERKLEIARAKLAIARLENEAFEAKQTVRARHLAEEVGLAEASLAKFQEADKPTPLASVKLDLRTTKDRAQEARDELAQIEIMYAEQDLDDLTAEFVVSRGRRQAERAEARIEIKEAELKALAERELPQEAKRLGLAVDRAKADAEAAAREAEIGRRNKAIAVQEAENAVEDLEEELVEAKKEANA
jgi:hypothetical protein